jgi:hypothetical protein
MRTLADRWMLLVARLRHPLDVILEITETAPRVPPGAQS